MGRLNVASIKDLSQPRDRGRLEKEPIAIFMQTGELHALGDICTPEALLSQQDAAEILPTSFSHPGHRQY